MKQEHGQEQGQGNRSCLEISVIIAITFTLTLITRPDDRRVVSPRTVFVTTCPVAYSQLVLITVALAKVIANSAMGSEKL